MASIIGKKGNQTTKQVLEDQAKQAEKQRNQPQPVVDNANANKQAEIYAEDREINEMLTRAASYGVKLDANESFKQDAADVVKAKEVDDYKGIAMLKNLETVLSVDELALLPIPGSTKAEEQAKRKEGDNKPLLYDKPKASGGRAKVETFYGNLVKHTSLGKAASDELERIDTAIAKAGKQTDLLLNLGSEKRKAQRTITQLLSSLRLAATVRLKIVEIQEKLPHIVMEWIREPTDTEPPANADLMMLNVPDAGDVVHSPQCLIIYSEKAGKTQATAFKTAEAFSLGTFKRWRVDRAIAIAKAKGQPVTMDDLKDSAKKPPEQPKQTPPASAVSDAEKDKRWKPTDIVDVKRSIEGTLRWYHGDSPVDESANDMALVKAIDASDEMCASGFALFKILERAYMDSKRVAKAQAFIKAGEKAA